MEGVCLIFMHGGNVTDVNIVEYDYYLEKFWI